MFFWEGDKNKKILLFVLVSFFTIFIIFQWLEHNPIKKIISDKTDDEYWTEFDEAFSDTGEILQNNFEKAELGIISSIEEEEQRLKQEELIETTKEYLENKKNSTSSKATSTIE